MFYVINREDNSTSMSDSMDNEEFEDRSEAITRAEELASEHPRIAFEVVTTVHSVRCTVNKPVVTDVVGAG